MSKTIWVVNEHLFEYGDTFTHPVRAFPSEERAAEYAKQLNKECKEEEDLIDKWREEDHDCLEDLDVSFENYTGEIEWYKECSEKCISCKVHNSVGRRYDYTALELEVD